VTGSVLLRGCLRSAIRKPSFEINALTADRGPLPTQTENPIIAGEAAILARRYAGALYELADEQKQLDAVADDLRALKVLECESADFRAFTGNPRLSRKQLVQAAQQVSGAAKFNKLTSNFLALVAQNRRLAQLNGMCNAFLNELAARRGEFSAEVRAARPLTPTQQEQLAEQLHALAGGKVHMSVSEDRSLLGGLIVKLGSKLIDASVKSKLARLERQLKNQSLNIVKGAA
jgi:F-type H+-transporting ATPase subunit delta